MIGYGIGLAALLVLLAIVVRSARHRVDLMLTVADFLALLGDSLDRGFGEWAYSRALRAQAKGHVNLSRLWFRVERRIAKLFFAIFALAWKAEGWALRDLHYNPGHGLSAASSIRNYDDDDDLLFADDDDYGPPYDDYRYDY